MKILYPSSLLKAILLFFAFNYSNSFSQCAITVSISANGSGNYTFTPQVSIPSGWMYFINWNFGDGNSLNGQQVSHQYNTTGGFLVTANMFSYDPSDSTQNCSAISYDTVYYSGFVGGNCSLIANVGYLNTSGTTYNIYGSSSGGNTSYSYLSVYSSTGGFSMFPNTANATVTLPSSGSSQVCYYVEDSTATNYCYDSACVMISPGNPSNACMASILLWQDSINTMTWYGYNLSTGAAPLTYFWDFGDGNNSNQAFPSHTYSVPGTYLVCLTITDNNGCTSSVCDSSMAFRFSSLSATTVSQLNILNPLSINDLKSFAQVELYPNPVMEKAMVTFESGVSSNASIELRNILGEKIKEQNINVVRGKNKIEVSFETLTNGIYFIDLKVNGNIQNSIKVVK